jgi:hypothetical protein
MAYYRVSVINKNGETFTRGFPDTAAGKRRALAAWSDVFRASHVHCAMFFSHGNRLQSVSHSSDVVAGPMFSPRLLELVV